MKDRHLTEEDFGLLLDGDERSDVPFDLFHLTLCPVCFAVGASLLKQRRRRARAAPAYAPMKKRRPEDPIPSFYWHGLSELPLIVGNDRSLRLPAVILWAFGLQEGDILTVSRDAIDSGRFFFEGYTQALGTITRGISHPWPYIEELLRLPMASLNSLGTLFLPKEAGSLDGRPGEVRRLVVEERPFQGSFSLEPGERTFAPRLCLEIIYVLPVENIRVPANLSSIARLEERCLVCETGLGLVKFRVSGSNESSLAGDPLSLGPEGFLPLPKPFLRELRPEWDVRLSARIASEPSFQLSYYLGERALGLPERSGDSET
jgi:hypothetical protein